MDEYMIRIMIKIKIPPNNLMPPSSKLHLTSFRCTVDLDQPTSSVSDIVKRVLERDQTRATETFWADRHRNVSGYS
ncbi:hypothetical protein HanRHA438_Chr15g0701521 [Helianthus annuus]|nr:hypothetical protein HanHA300_Chr15g0561451 [Helianthus annuus]KAJ0472760.1 hypothetical protein HanHA89_Chr15g0610661 [Helianthus annuus]KAJ0648367.1 hypothetical protein HanLR1_Chr15g0572071 [Helianthus annuus]KAJ0844357.1 hypothetical protein HanRHA438_Chr15g0701521 [Helianthus annuus]